MPSAGKIMLRNLPLGADAGAVMDAVHAALDARHVRATLVYFEEGKLKCVAVSGV